MKKRRRGFWRDLDQVFEAAHEMVGGTVHPDERTLEHKRLDDLKCELRAEIAAGDFARKLATGLMTGVVTKQKKGKKP